MRTYMVRVACALVCMVCVYAWLHVYMWATSATWEWARMVSVLPTMVLLVVGVVSLCGVCSYRD
jgi:ABC-type polysaccharide/polyol phosphate export permease